MTFNGPIGELIEFSIGGGWGSDVEKSGYSEVAVIRGTDIPKVAMGDYSTVPRRFESTKKLTSRLLKSGDIVLETAGGSSAKGQFTGRTLLVTDDILQSLGPTICASFCKRLELNTAIVEPGFFYWYMQDLYKSGRVSMYDSQSTGISNFQFSSFLESEFLNLPDLAAQRAIANSLSSVNSLMKSNLENAQLLEKIAQSIFKSWFVDFDPVKAKMAGEKPVGMDDATAALFPDSMEDSELGPIPKGWECKTADNIFSVGIGRTPPRKEPEWFCEGGDGVDWVSIRDMGSYGVFSSGTSEGLTEEAVKKFRVPIVPKGTVLMSFKLTVGKLCITDRDLVTNEAIAHFKQNESSPISSLFAYLWLSNHDMESLDSTSSIGTATNSGRVKAIKFLIPSAHTISHFESLASPLFNQIESLTAQSRKLVELRDSLLPRLISGELRIPDEMLVS